jgi:hypothetical protein
MDSDLIMSATAGASLREDVLTADYWRAFAPGAEPADTLARVSTAVEKPHLSAKCEASPGIALRARFDGRLGVAGVIVQGEVTIAFPIVKEGRVLDLEIVEAVSGWNDREGWVVAEYEGVRFGFYDVLHSVGLGKYRNGERHRFVVNAFALSLRKVKPLLCPTDPDGDLFPFSLKNLRAYLPRKSGYDRGIFQSPIDGAPENLVYDTREFTCLPVSLGDEDGIRATIDLFVSPELAESLGSPLCQDDEVAGIIWLQGYAADKLEL